MLLYIEPVEIWTRLNPNGSISPLSIKKFPTVEYEFSCWEYLMFLLQNREFSYLLKEDFSRFFFFSSMKIPIVKDEISVRCIISIHYVIIHSLIQTLPLEMALGVWIGLIVCVKWLNGNFFTRVIGLTPPGPQLTNFTMTHGRTNYPTAILYILKSSPHLFFNEKYLPN